MYQSFKKHLKKEIVLIISFLLALITSFLNTPKINYINFEVLALLFLLMLLVGGFINLKILDFIALFFLKQCKTYRGLSMVLIFITFISSMLITNDVALITLVPLSIILGIKAHINVLKIIIFQTLAANLGSSLTPMGNPQNLFLYSFSGINPLDFFLTMAPLTLISILFILLLILKEPKTPLNIPIESFKLPINLNLFIYSILFFCTILSIFHIIPLSFIFIITTISILFLDYKLFYKVDYSLLAIFICFFIFVGNLSSLEIIKNFMQYNLNTPHATFLNAILISQLISNVPAALLLADFTPFIKELLLGVNVGGLGTIIASLASLISYKLYIKEYKNDSKEFLKNFTLYNILGLIIFIPFLYILI